MRRRYTVHRDGDLLVEELDEHGVPIDPEPVAPEDRLPIEVVVRLDATDDVEQKAQLLELLEMAYDLERESMEHK